LALIAGSTAGAELSRGKVNSFLKARLRRVAWLVKSNLSAAPQYATIFVSYDNYAQA